MVVKLKVLYCKCKVENVRQCRQIPENMCNTVFERGGFIEIEIKTAQECSAEMVRECILVNNPVCNDILKCPIFSSMS